MASTSVSQSSRTMNEQLRQAGNGQGNGNDNPARNTPEPPNTPPRTGPRPRDDPPVRPLATGPDLHSPRIPQAMPAIAAVAPSIPKNRFSPAPGVIQNDPAIAARAVRPLRRQEEERGIFILREASHLLLTDKNQLADLAQTYRRLNPQGRNFFELIFDNEWNSAQASYTPVCLAKRDTSIQSCTLVH